MTNRTVPGPAEWPWVGSVGKLAANPLSFFQELTAEYGDMARFSMFG